MQLQASPYIGSWGQCGAAGGRLSCCLDDLCGASLRSRTATARWQTDGGEGADLSLRGDGSRKRGRNSPDRGERVLPKPRDIHDVHVGKSVCGKHDNQCNLTLRGTDVTPTLRRTFTCFTLAGDSDPEGLVNLKTCWTVRILNSDVRY